MIPRSGYTDQDQDKDQDQDQDHDQNQNQNQDQDQNQNQQQAKKIVIVCKDDREWIDPEIGEYYIGVNKCDVNMITSKNKSKIEDCVIVLDDMGDKLSKVIA